MRRAPVKWNRDQFTKCPFQRAPTHPTIDQFTALTFSFQGAPTLSSLNSSIMPRTPARKKTWQLKCYISTHPCCLKIEALNFWDFRLVLPSWRYKMTFVWPSLYFSFSSPTVPMITIAIACCCFSSET